MRESNDTPRLKAFCRVAPSVLLSVRAIFLAGVFSRARVFNSRTSVLVHSRRFEFLLAMSSPIYKQRTQQRTCWDVERRRTELRGSQLVCFPDSFGIFYISARREAGSSLFRRMDHRSDPVSFISPLSRYCCTTPRE